MSSPDDNLETSELLRLPDGTYLTDERAAEAGERAIDRAVADSARRVA